MQSFNISIASDHSGFDLKTAIINYFRSNKLSIKDFGAYNPETTDYPLYANKVTQSIIEGISNVGILICATGIGMSIAANRYSGIRAALCTDLFMVERARQHNDANILIIGAKITSEELAIEMIDKFLSTKFEGGRHTSRLSQIN